MLPSPVVLGEDLLKLLVITVNHRQSQMIAMASLVVFNLITQGPELVHRGAVDHSRTNLKPEIPVAGAYGIPLRDEIELEKHP